jgi:glycosyltransferase involved in cell wall biosynthesis
MRSLQDGLTVVVPAFNEEKSVGKVLTELCGHLLQKGISFEVVVIDDGSTDDTADIVLQVKQKFPSHVFLHSNGINRGYGFSLKKGSYVAKFSLLLFFDADGQHPVSAIDDLLSESNSETDLVIAQRTNQSASPRWRRPGKAVIKLLAEKVTRVPVYDLFSGLRLWRTVKFLEISKILPNAFSISTTSLIASLKLGFTISWVNYEARPRIGRSTASIMDGFTILLLMVRILILFSPLRIFLPVSFFILVVGVGSTIASYTSLGEASTKGLIFIFAAVSVALQGLIVDQVSATRRGETVSQ